MVSAPTGGDVYRRAFAEGIRPSDRLKVWEWADKHRFLAGEMASEQGQYRTDRTPYWRELMECLSESSPVETVSLCKGTQIGASELLNNFLGYIMDVAPGPVLVVQPDLDGARLFSTQRVTPMLEANPRLLALVAKAKSRSSGNTILLKRFRGGLLRLIGSHAAASLGQMPARYVLLDEVDRYPPEVGREGDPVNLAVARTATFGRRRKIFLCSSPTISGSSRIETAFLEGDQRYYHVPCPFCLHYQRLIMLNLRWVAGKNGKPDPETAKYFCEQCGAAIEEGWKTWMFERGHWVPTNHDAPEKIRSYHLSSIYAPEGWRSWVELAELRIAAEKKPGLLKTFFNTSLGETWKEIGEAPPWQTLWNRRERYRQGTVPRGVVFLTAGADVQRDRIEVEVVGWGRDQESWSIDYRVLEGDTSKPDVWRELDKMMLEAWPHVSGVALSIRKLCCDASYNPLEVAKWCRRQAGGRAIPIRGEDRMPAIIGAMRHVDVSAKGKKRRRGLKYLPVGVSAAKVELYGRLRLEPPGENEPWPPAYCHFPQEYEGEHFKRLTAEELRFVPTRTGFMKPEWHRIYARNEQLDCRVYARAAAALLGIDQMVEENWAELEQDLGLDAPDSAAQTAQRESGPMFVEPGGTSRRRPEPPKDERRAKKGWMSRWRKDSR
jgi:phage terminase large subunit GpA-like protein